MRVGIGLAEATQGIFMQTYEETYLELTGYSREELAKWELPLMAERGSKRDFLAIVSEYFNIHQMKTALNTGGYFF